MNPVERILQVRAGGAVKRSHVTRQHGVNTVAEHTWGVLSLVYLLYPNRYPDISAHVLFHDVPEFHTGDAPAPVKRYSREVKQALEDMEDQIFGELQLPNPDQLSWADQQLLTACDKLELYLWCIEQLQFGNLFASETLEELETYFEEQPPPERVANVLKVLRHTDLDRLLPKQAGKMREMNNK